MIIINRSKTAWYNESLNKLKNNLRKREGLYKFINNAVYLNIFTTYRARDNYRHEFLKFKNLYYNNKLLTFTNNPYNISYYTNILTPILIMYHILNIFPIILQLK